MKTEIQACHFWLSLSRQAPRLGALGAMLLLASCASSVPVADTYLGRGSLVRDDHPKRAPHDKVSYWDGEGVQGAPYIVVDLREQQARFYKGGMLVGISAISSGTEGKNTPPGNYTILEKDADHHSSLYGRVVDAEGNVVDNNATPKTPVPPGGRYEPSPMPNFMRLTRSGVGMHQGFLPGYPASHGCIRMDAEMAKIFFDNVTVGVPATIVR